VAGEFLAAFNFLTELLPNHFGYFLFRALPKHFEWREKEEESL